jgi:hypothetical protein
MPFMVGARLGLLIILVIFGVIVGGVTITFNMIVPNASISHWLAANYPWLVSGACVAFAIYAFCRNVLDTKTGD